MKNTKYWALICVVAVMSLIGCSKTNVLPDTFIKAEPAVDAVVNRHPRTLRVYLTALPNIGKSSLRLFGEQGEISLSRFHTMGADDLMIEIDDHPLPNGVYRVEWDAVIGEDEIESSGQYEFTVAVE